MPGHHHEISRGVWISLCPGVWKIQCVEGSWPPVSLLPLFLPLPLAGMSPLHTSTASPPFSFRFTHPTPALALLRPGQHTLTSPCWGWGCEAQTPALPIFLSTPFCLDLQASTQSPSGSFICVIVTAILQLINPLVIQVQPCFRSDPHKSWWAEMLVQKKYSFRASSLEPSLMKVRWQTEGRKALPESPLPSKLISHLPLDTTLDLRLPVPLCLLPHNISGTQSQVSRLPPTQTEAF